MSKIKVHVLEYYGCANTHAEIVLEENTTEALCASETWTNLW